jgi:hypothetical protein
MRCGLAHEQGSPTLIVIAVMVIVVVVIAVMVIAVMVIAVMVIAVICRSRRRSKGAEQQA